jgi:hypothetical protein
MTIISLQKILPPSSQYCRHRIKMTMEPPSTVAFFSCYLRQKHLSCSKKITDNIHSVHQGSFDHVKWTAGLLTGLFDILNHMFRNAFRSSSVASGATGNAAKDLVVTAALNNLCQLSTEFLEYDQADLYREHLIDFAKTIGSRLHAKVQEDESMRQLKMHFLLNAVILAKRPAIAGAA